MLLTLKSVTPNAFDHGGSVSVQFPIWGASHSQSSYSSASRMFCDHLLRLRNLLISHLAENSTSHPFPPWQGLYASLSRLSILKQLLRFFSSKRKKKICFKLDIAEIWCQKTYLTGLLRVDRNVFVKTLCEWLGSV